MDLTPVFPHDVSGDLTSKLEDIAGLAFDSKCWNSATARYNTENQPSNALRGSVYTAAVGCRYLPMEERV